MTRAVLIASVPWLVGLVVSFGLLYLLSRVSCAKIELPRLRHLHGDQGGSAQSLSFVLTLPLFIMVLMVIVQISQVWIGQIVVQYAAFAAARTAAVWVPANLPPEDANCISSGYALDPNNPDQVAPSMDGPSPPGGETFVIQPGKWIYEEAPGEKCKKIAMAAALACMPISPSRSQGASLTGEGAATAEIVKAAYAAMAPTSYANTAAIPKRIEHKLAYAMANTAVEVRFYHSNREPPLHGQLGSAYGLGPDPQEFQSNELGWQDQITVTVTHKLALLPGPGRLLAKYGLGIGGSMGRATSVSTDQYTFPLSASATIGNEGEKSVVPYVYANH
jgi:hypothetical protein